MMNCVFCNISKDSSNEEYRIIYLDKKYIAMLVSRPESKGHFILFPRRHCSELIEMRDKATFFELAIKLAEEKTKMLNAGAYTLKLNNNVFKLNKDPLHVGHIHIHIIPRYFQNDSIVDKPNMKDREYFIELKRIINT